MASYSLPYLTVVWLVKKIWR